MTFLVGAKVEDATPTWPARLSGFAARRGLSIGAHDPISVRALAVDDTCLICIDVVGLDDETCAQIRASSPFADDHVFVAATHTHGGPAVMNGHLGTYDREARQLIALAAVRAATGALRDRQPATLEFADAGPAPVATDRRRGGRPAEARMQALRWKSEAGATIAWLATYPCHPVVLGPNNRLFTGDYPAALRDRLEEVAPGSIAVFATGCAGDINVGHNAAASFSRAADLRRTFEEATRIGRLLANLVLNANWCAIAEISPTATRTEPVVLTTSPLDGRSVEMQRTEWQAQLDETTDEGHAAVLAEWIAWSATPRASTKSSWVGSVSVVRWASVTLVFLPGEPFLQTAVEIARHSVSTACLVLGYTNGCPGYLPPADAYGDGGYEVTDAHRYYGMPSPFSQGCAELLRDRAVDGMRELEGVSPRA
jgi:neutral ceramidase